MISVLLNGASGKMGSTAAAAIEAHPKLSLIAACDHNDNFAGMLAELKPDVALDFTTPDAVLKNTQTIIENNVRPVIGTSGLMLEQVQALQTQCAAKKLGGIIAPNFCIGAILMMRFAEQAAKYYPQAEIIEYHHDRKKDAPSGTSIKTAQMLSNVRPNQYNHCEETIAGARGANLNDVPIHSVRLQGMLAHQEVLFGSEGELLTIRHDSFTREAYMPGVCFAIEKVMQLNELIYGLETLL